MNNQDNASRLATFADAVPLSQSHSPARKNLLIGAITNYVWDDVAPFFNSYVQAGFENCDFVMFTRDMSGKTIDRIRSCGVMVFPIPESLRKSSIINCRWKIYSDYLNSSKGKYDLVFTADVRDLIFQQDVFKFLDNSNDFLGVAIDDETLTEARNRAWLVNAYGQELYETIKDERIICVGTVWGTPDKFTEFSEIMWEKLSSEWSLSRKAIEQAVGNFIIYHDGMFADVLRPSSNQHGPVMTLALTDIQDIHTDINGRVLNGRGEIAAVVHQYDRKLPLVKAAISKYGAGMSSLSKLIQTHPRSIFWNILRFSWTIVNRMLQ